MTSENEKSWRDSPDGTINGHKYHMKRGRGKWRGSQGSRSQPYTPYGNNYYERTFYNSWNNNRNSNSQSLSRSSRNNRYNKTTPHEKNKPFYHYDNNDSNISFNENDFISSTAYKLRSPKRQNQNYPQERQSSHYESFIKDLQSYNRHNSDCTSAKSSSAMTSQKDKETFKEWDSERKQIARIDSSEKTNSNGTVKNKKKSKGKKNSQAKIKKTGKVNKKTTFPISDNFYVIDSEAPIENINTDNDIHTQRDYICKSHLKFPETNSPHSNINISMSSKKQSRIKNVNSQEALQNELQNSDKEKFVSNKPVKVKNNEILNNEMELYENFSKTDSSSKNTLYSSSFTNLKLKPLKNLKKISQDKKPVGSDNIDERHLVFPTQCQFPTQYPCKVSKIPEMSQEGDINERLLALTQSQSPTPSLSIPCGQQITSEIVEFSPKKEMENDIERCLADFFSQMSPPTFSQEPIRESQMISNDKYVSNILNLNPHSEMKVTTNEEDKMEMSTLSSIKCQMQSKTGKGSASKLDKPVSGSMLSHSDEDIINSSQISCTSSSVLLDVNSLRNLSNSISRKTPLASSVSQPSLCNSSASLQEENISFLKSCTTPVTSTQVSDRIKKISFPDYSPLVRECSSIPTFVNNTNKQLQPLSQGTVSQSILSSPLEMQKICTQPFETNANLLNSNSSSIYSTMNSLTIINSCTRDIESIKIKMEGLFDIPDSQCSINEFPEMKNQEIMDSENHLISESQDKEQENNKESSIENIETLSDAAEDQCVNEVITIDVPQDRFMLADKNKELEIIDEEKNQEKKVIISGIIEENLESISKNEEREEGSLHIKGCVANYFDDGKETVIVEKEEMRKKYEPNLSVDKCDKDLNKENQNPDGPNGCIEAYDSKVEEVVRKFHDLCEKKKRKFLKNKKPIRFSIKFQDEAKGFIVSKDVLEFVLMEDDNEEAIKRTLSVTVDSTSGVEKHENSSPIKDFSVGVSLGEKITEQDGEEKKHKKRKKKRLDESPETLLRWWDGYTKDIPASIFQTNKETKWETSKYNFDNENEKLSGSSKPRELNEDSNDEDTLRSKKKLKKSKKSKRLENQDIIIINSELESVPVASCQEMAEKELESVPVASCQKMAEKELESVPGEVCQEMEKAKEERKIKRNKKKLDKERTKKQNIYNKSKTPPFCFKKFECQPGKKRLLLNNYVDNCWFDT